MKRIIFLATLFICSLWAKELLAEKTIKVKHSDHRQTQQELFSVKAKTVSAETYVFSSSLNFANASHNIVNADRNISDVGNDILNVTYSISNVSGDILNATHDRNNASGDIGILSNYTLNSSGNIKNLANKIFNNNGDTKNHVISTFNDNGDTENLANGTFNNNGNTENLANGTFNDNGDTKNLANGTFNNNGDTKNLDNGTFSDINDPENFKSATFSDSINISSAVITPNLTARNPADRSARPKNNQPDRPLELEGITLERVAPTPVETGVKLSQSNDAVIPSIDPSVPVSGLESSQNDQDALVSDTPVIKSVPTHLEGITLQRVPVRIAQTETVSLTPPKILAPIPNSVLDIPSTTVVVQFPMGTKVEVRVNGKKVPDNQVGTIVEDSTAKTITQTWVGVTLDRGESVIEVYRVGETTPIATSKVITRGGISGIQLQTVETRIPADGKTTATIQGQLLDDRGNRSNQTAVITLSASQGEFVGKDAKPDLEGWQVEAIDGKFTAVLRSSLNSGNVRIRAASVNDNKLIEGFTELLFETNLRSSIVTGVIDLRYGARGTDFYSSFRDFLPADRNNDAQLRLYGAVFGTGQIGEWLFTGAYNSQRTLNETCAGQPSVFGSSDDCDSNYYTYGDNSTSTRTTPSYNNLFLRLERTSPVPNAGIEYFMWGDFRTEEFANPAQQFTALNRSLSGFKLNYNIGDLQVTGFYNVLGSGFQRDSIAPDGTSGFYFLSRRELVNGSETIAIETVELQNPTNITARQVLQRGTDYDIDYDRGSLLFRNGISQTTIGSDGTLLRRQIIATYEYRSGEDTNSYAGQARYMFNRVQGLESWIGVTYFRENQGTRNFTIYGANAQVYFSRDIKLQAEYGRSESLSPEFGFVAGSAYRLELDAKISETIRASAFYRSADSGFTNNATLSFTAGQTRYGAKVDATLSNQTSIRAAVEREENRGIAPTPTNSLDALLNPNTFINPGTRQDNDLTTFTLGIDQKLGSALLSLDYIYRDRVDRVGTLNSSSSQLRSRLTTPLADNLRLVLQNEMTLGGTSDTVYNDRTTLGLTWEIAKGLNFTLGQQWYHSGQLAGQAITTAEIAGEYKLGEDTTLTGRFSVLSGGQDTVTQGGVGFRQRWVITEGLRLNLAYERVFGTPLRLGTGVQFSQPFAVGQTASSLALLDGDNYSIGIDYAPNPDFKADLKFEQRNSSTGTNTVLSASAVGKISPDLWILGRYQQANIANQGLGGIGNTVNFRLGLAYRPVDNDTFNALLRYEYRRNPSTIPETVLFGTGTGYEDHTFAIEAIYAPNYQWEFYGKFALRNSSTTFANDLVGTGAVSLAQLRATYRLSNQFDITGEARFINQPTAGFSETGFVAELGYWMSPSLRLAVGYSSGAVNSDRDFSGSRSAGGLFLGVTLRVDQLFDNFGVQRPLPAPPAPPVTASSPVPTTQANQRISWTVSQKISDEGKELSNADRLVLDNLSVVLKSSNAIVLDIQSPIAITDIQNKDNALTQRLTAIRNYLTQRGINSSQIVFRSLGANADNKISFIVSGDTNSFRNIVSSLQAQPNSPASQFFNTLLSQVPPAPAPIIAQAVRPDSPDPRRISQTIQITPDGKIADRSQAILNQLISTAISQPNTDIELTGDLNRNLAIRRYLIEKGINSDRILFSENANTPANAVILSLSATAENVATTPPPANLVPPSVSTQPEPIYQSLNQWQTAPLGLRLQDNFDPIALLPIELLNPENITILPNPQLLSLLIPDDIPAIIANGIDNVPVDLRLTTALNFLLNNFSDPLTALKESIGIGGQIRGEIVDSKDLTSGGI